MNRYMLPINPISNDIKSLYPWDATQLTVILKQIYDHAVETGYKDSFISFTNELGNFMSQISNLTSYNGKYEVTPLAHLDQILKTSNTYLSDNIIIEKIPYYETSNEAGGYTVIIG